MQTGGHTDRHNEAKERFSWVHEGASVFVTVLVPRIYNGLKQF
jgi:hypothetical protein